MRNIITITSLLAIATVCASAAVPKTNTWEQVDFTLNGNTQGHFSVTNKVGMLDRGRAGFGSFTVGSESLTSISVEDYSWKVSFNLNVSSVSETQMLFSSLGSANGSGYSISVTQTDSKFVYDLRSDNAQIVSKPVVSSTSTINTITATNNTDSVSLIWDSVANTLYLSVGEQSLAYSGLTKPNLTLTTNSNISSGQPNGGAIFWANGTATKLNNITLSVKAIPEPSAFGLLAGLGALALVGARRRRRK